MAFLRKMWDEKPLAAVMLAAILARLVAVFLARGYGMLDDHFLVLERAHDWMRGIRLDPSHPLEHSLVYPGLHYLLLVAFKKMGRYNPDGIMYLVRFLHAAFSLLTVYFGYKITLLRFDRHRAASVALLLALLWVFPSMSVRNLIEMACAPFLVIAGYHAVRYDDTKRPSFALWAGVFCGLAFVFRYQTAVVPLCMGLVLLVRRDILAAACLAAGFAVSSFLVQGMTDIVAYGRPYASFMAYFLYNKTAGGHYVTQPWYTYIFTLTGVLIPPISLLLMFGFLRTWKRMALLFWPTLLFLVFHSLYPNKQERFLLPVMPFIVILGMIGWWEFADKSAFCAAHRKLLRGCWIFFWCANSVLLLAGITTYSKRARVETMNFLRERADASALVFESADGIPLVPFYYLGKTIPAYQMPPARPLDSLKADIAASGVAPNYIVFINDKNLDSRRQRLAPLFPRLEFCTAIEPSLIDRLLHALNPKHNANEECFVYHIQ